MAVLKAGAIEVPVSGAVRNMVLRVKAKGVRRFRARLWLGGQIIRFAAWVIGMRGEVEIEIEGGDLVKHRPTSDPQRRFSPRLTLKELLLAVGFGLVAMFILFVLF